ncbi:MAG: transporter substrate-binding domain-containing protein [Lentisphaeria bacterium]|nr:transporter substrate-binding domain-containing protein [Lentisphaeria bacterium]
MNLYNICRRSLPAMLAAIALLGAAGCPDSSGRGKSAGDVFTVGFECGFEPHGFIDQNTKEYTGFDIELAREVARRNSWKPVLRPIDWNLKDNLLKSGEIDCIWNGFMINGREGDYEWSDPYSESRQVVIVRDGSPVRTLTGLTGKNVAVQAASATYQALTQGALEELGKRFNKIVPITEFQLLMEELATGDSYDAVIADVYAARRWIEDSRAKLTVTDITIWKTHDGVAFLPGNKALRDQVQNTLDEMRQDGTLARISIKWFRRDVSPRSGNEPGEHQ